MGCDLPDAPCPAAHDLKQPQAAEEFYRRDVAVFEKLAAEFSHQPSYRGWLADAHREWAFCLRDNGRPQEARELFDLAIASLSKAVELRSEDLWGVWYPLALLHLSTGRTEEYRTLCETLLEHFGQADDPDLWVVRICRLAPDAAADLARPVRIAEKSLARHPHDADLACVLGETLYRKGDLDAAVRHLEASILVAPGIDVHRGKLFLAMAYHRLGRTRPSTATAPGGRRVGREEWPGEARRRSGPERTTALVAAAGFTTASPRGRGAVGQVKWPVIGGRSGQTRTGGHEPLANDH